MENNTTLSTAEFEALPLNVQRVMIARDVINRVVSGFYNAKSIYFSKDDITLTESSDIRTNFEQLEGCSVCAWGGVLLSTTLFKNRLTLHNVYRNDREADKLLSEVFENVTLALMENAFETRTGSHAENQGLIQHGGRFLRKYRKKLWRKQVNKAIEFGMKYEDDDKKHRLLAIMYNIISNNGVFIP